MMFFDVLNDLNDLNDLDDLNDLNDQNYLNYLNDLNDLSWFLFVGAYLRSFSGHFFLHHKGLYISPHPEIHPIHPGGYGTHWVPSTAD